MATEEKEMEQLMNIFIDKVREQTETVEKIHKAVQASTEMMNKSTDELIRAKDDPGGLCKYVVVFVAVAASTLITTYFLTL